MVWVWLSGIDIYKFAFQIEPDDLSYDIVMQILKEIGGKIIKPDLS